MRKIIRGLVLAAFVAVPLVLAASLNMNEGLWETSTSMNGKKLATEQKCYLKKDVVELEKMLRGELVKPKQPCKFSDYKESGNAVNYTMTCTFGGKPSVSQVTSTYNGDTAKGAITANGTVSVLESKRTGSCSKSSFD